MIPPLPVELLRLVVNNLRLPKISSSHLTWTQQQELRNALYSLCLTSRLFCLVAQPLLFEHMRIPVTWGDVLWSTLVWDNFANRTDLVSSVRSLVVADQYWTDEKYFDLHCGLSDLSRHALNLEEVLVLGTHGILDCFFGSSLTRLFLDGVDLDRWLEAGIHLLFLEVLSLNDTRVSLEAVSEVDGHSWPNLRHLLFDQQNSSLLPGDEAFLRRLAPRLDSVVISAYIYHAAVFDVPSIKPRKMLINASWNSAGIYLDLEDMTMEVIHVRILISDTLYEPEEEFPGHQSLEQLAGFVETGKLTGLESVYLPPLESLSNECRSETNMASIQRLIIACQKRRIEIVFEEQPAVARAECQISEEFMRRMTQKRLDKEGKKGGD